MALGPNFGLGLRPNQPYLALKVLTYNRQTSTCGACNCISHDGLELAMGFAQRKNQKFILRQSNFVYVIQNKFHLNFRQSIPEAGLPKSDGVENS